MLFKIFTKHAFLLSISWLIFIFSSFSKDLEKSIKWHNTTCSADQKYLVDVEILKANEDSITLFCCTNNRTEKYRGGNLMARYDCFIIKQGIKDDVKTVYPINRTFGEKTLPVLKEMYVDGALQMFYSFYNRKLKKVYLFHQSHNVDLLQTQTDIRKISEIDLNVEKGFSFDLDNMFILYDNGYYLFRYSVSTSQGDFYGMDVFDSQLNRVWKSFKIPMSGGKSVSESEYRIDSKANIYALQRIFINDKFKDSRLAVAKYPGRGLDPISIPLNLNNGNFITACQLDVKDDKIICGGMSAHAGMESAAGSFSIILNAQTGRVISENTYAFDKEFIAKGAGKQELEAFEGGHDHESLYSYLCDSIHFRNDGGFDVVFQKYYNVRIVHTDKYGSTVSTTYKHYYDDAYVLSFNPDGTQRWYQKLVKFTNVENLGRYTGDYYSFYDSEESLHFIFNLANQLGRNSQGKDKAQTLNVKFDQHGKQSFSVLETNSVEAMITCPMFSFQQDDGNIILAKFPYIFKTSGKKSKKLSYLNFGTLIIE